MRLMWFHLMPYTELPAGLDTLGARDQLERPLVMRPGADFRERLGTIEQPYGALTEIELQRTCIGIDRCASELRAMLGPDSDPVHGFAAEPCTQTLDQALPGRASSGFVSAGRRPKTRRRGTSSSLPSAWCRAAAVSST